MTTSTSAWVTQRLPADVVFDGQTVAQAVQAALDDNIVAGAEDKYAALADLWERIDAEMLYDQADLVGAFRMMGPMALKKAQYWRGLSASSAAPNKIQFIDANYSDVPSNSSSEYGTPCCGD